MWLTKLKIAIVEKNTKKLDELMDEIPKFENIADVESALYLTLEATKLVEELKGQTSNSMIKIQNNIKYLKSTRHHTSMSLDIKS